MPDNKEALNGLKGIFGGNRKPVEDPVHKLTRMELLELLIEQTREAEDLKKRNKELTAELARCRADLDRTASLEVVIRRLEEIAAKSPASQSTDNGAFAPGKEEPAKDPELEAWNQGLPMEDMTAGADDTEGND